MLGYQPIVRAGLDHGLSPQTVIEGQGRAVLLRDKLAINARSIYPSYVCKRRGQGSVTELRETPHNCAALTSASDDQGRRWGPGNG